MKQRLTPVLFFLLPLFISAQEINWISFEDAVVESQKEGNTKKVFIDVYTDWCGWCKKMDKVTFQNPEVAKFMQENFLMVKFNAEGKEPVEFEGKTYKYIPTKRRGYHELAVLLANGRLSYPTVVFYDLKDNVRVPVPGYREPKQLLEIAGIFAKPDYLKYLKRTSK